MTDMEHTHWTNDEELLARFVLGQINPDEASVLEQHLQECAECSVLVQAERLLAAGIKRSGRAEMKQRLISNIAQKDLGTFDWSRVASVAAAILFVITIWYVSRWFVPGEGPIFTQGTVTDTLVAQASSRIEKEEVPQVEPEAIPEDFVDAYPLPGDRAERTHVAASEAEGGKRKEAAAPSATDQKVLELLSNELWLKGAVIADARNPRISAEQIVAARGERRESDAPKGREMMAMAKAERPEFMPVDSVQVTVKQLPLAGLHDRRNDAVNAKQLIQTFIKKTKRGLDVTIFSDSLRIVAKRTAPAEGKVIGADSLVIQIGDRRIGYKFPSGWIRGNLPRPDTSR